MRRILHCDMDCYYAAIHIRDDPSLRGKPVVVGGDPTGRGVVAAASYEARKYGIHSAMPAVTAVRLCPQIVFLRADFDRYRETTAQIFDIYRDYTPELQTVGLDEAYLDVTDHLQPFGSATAVAQDIRSRVAAEVRLTVSVGVGPNRLIAKLASDYDKPDGLTVVTPDRVQEFLDPMPVRRLQGVGPSTEKLLHKLKILTIRDLRQMPLARLEHHLGQRGPMLHAFAHGRDNRKVHTSWQRKSLSTERTFADDLDDINQIRSHIARLSEQVASSIEKRKLWARTITIKVRYSDFTTITRSESLQQATTSTTVVQATARRLLDKTDADSRPVRLLGVGLSSLIGEDDPFQLTLFD